MTVIYLWFQTTTNGGMMTANNKNNKLLKKIPEDGSYL